MKRIITLFVLLTTTFLYSQSSGITYQAVLYNPSGEILPGNNNANAVLSNKDICLRFSITDAQTSLEYQETQKVKTDEFGMVNLLIGSGSQVGGYVTNFSAIVWNSSSKKLQVEIDVTGTCANFIEVSKQDFSAVPFAYASKTAENVTGIVPITNGGTGSSTVSGAKTNLGLNNVDNTSDLNKPISLATQTALNGKENTANKSTNTSLGTSDVLFPTQNAVKTYVDNQISSGVVDATTTIKGKIKLTGDLGGTADVPTVPGLATKEPILIAGTTSQYYRGDKTWQNLDKTAVSLSNVDNTSDASKPISTATQTALNAKENVSNKSTSITLGTSDVLYPTQNAVKTYVDNQITAVTVSDATTTTKGKIQLGGDLAGTNSSAANPIISNAAISTLKIADNAVTNIKIGGVISVNKGGTGSDMSNTSGYLKQTTTGSNFTSVSSIPVEDVTGAVRSVNGVFPTTNGNVSVIIGQVTTGTNLDPTQVVATPHNSDIYVVSGQIGTPNDNGRTFISDGASWHEIATNIASLENTFVKLSGSTMFGNLVFPTGKKITIADAPIGSTDVANKNYVDTKIGGSGTVNFISKFNSVSLLENSNLFDNGTNVGIGTITPTSKLEVNGAATNVTAFNSVASTTIDFSKSNLAYTTASAGAFILTNIKDGGTFTLAVQGVNSGISTFTCTGFTFKYVNNGITSPNKHTLYTFLVMGTTVYVYMATGF
jgi:hypothetical protein